MPFVIRYQAIANSNATDEPFQLELATKNFRSISKAMTAMQSLGCSAQLRRRPAA
jgi:hypothetical protein